MPYNEVNCVKEYIQKELVKKKGEFVSSSALCQAGNVSRNAVWKYICALREEGYEIEAAPRKGYRLTGCDRVPCAPLIQEALEGSKLWKQVFVHPVLGSTSKYLKEHFFPAGTVVIAQEQSDGRGRLGRSWTSKKGDGLYLSFLIQPQGPAEQIPLYSLAAGLAVKKAVAALTGLDCGLKWPNDVVLGKKKVCGILAELTGEIQQLRCIVGIGVNVYGFPQELSSSVTCLKEHCAGPISLSQLAGRILLEFEGLYQHFSMEEYTASCLTLGKQVLVLQGDSSWKGLAKGISPGGDLLVEDESGALRPVRSGEVSVRGLYGYV